MRREACQDNINLFKKESMNIPKDLSEVIVRRTDNAMAK